MLDFFTRNPGITFLVLMPFTIIGIKLLSYNLFDPSAKVRREEAKMERIRRKEAKMELKRAREEWVQFKREMRPDPRLKEDVRHLDTPFFLMF